jgi:DNA-binding MarR family transcriptional regulator
MIVMQKPHTSAADPLDATPCNCLALRQAARHVTQIYDRYLAAEGLRTTQYSILSKLSRLGPLSINQLAAMMVMDRTTTGRAVRPLERDKLVVIGADADGRKRVVRLTPAGEKRAKAARLRWRAAQDAFESAYGAEDAARLRTTLARVVAAG